MSVHSTGPGLIEQYIGPRVRQLREERRWAVTELVRRLHLIGADVNDDTIYKLEKGQRAYVPVNLLVQVAYILDVSPLVLLLPATDEPIFIAPEVSAPAADVYEWIVGDRPAPTAGELTDEARTKARTNLLRFLFLPLAASRARREAADNIDTDVLTELINEINRARGGDTDGR